MTTLSAVDFLGLAEQRRVTRIDLADAGYNGVVYACELTTAQQQDVLTRPKQGKTRVYADKSMDINWSDLPADAAPRWLAACLVTDTQDGKLLERAFAETQEASIVLAVSELVYMYDLWLAELKKKTAVMDKLAELPNAVTDLIVRRVREISGMDEDAVEKKKAS